MAAGNRWLLGVKKNDGNYWAMYRAPSIKKDFLIFI